MLNYSDTINVDLDSVQFAPASRAIVDPFGLPQSDEIKDVLARSAYDPHVSEVLLRRSQSFRQDKDLGWGVDGLMSRGATYEIDFGQMLAPCKTFAKLIERRRAAGGSTNILDLFGSGVMIPNPTNADSITGVRLVDVLIAACSDANWRQKREVVEGDLFQPGTWRSLLGNMQRRGIANFDLITMRPAGPLCDFEACFSLRERQSFHSAYLGILESAYLLLNRENGRMFASLPLALDRERWAHDLREAGIETQVGSGMFNPSIGIKRSAAAPERLPVPKELGRPVP